MKYIFEILFILTIFEIYPKYFWNRNHNKSTILLLGCSQDRFEEGWTVENENEARGQLPKSIISRKRSTKKGCDWLSPRRRCAPSFLCRLAGAGLSLGFFLQNYFQNFCLKGCDKYCGMLYMYHKYYQYLFVKALKDSNRYITLCLLLHSRQVVVGHGCCVWWMKATVDQRE